MFTGSHFPFVFLRNVRRNGSVYLALCWTAGLLFGGFVSAGAGDAFSSWMRAVDFDSVSIVGLLTASLLPFLLSAFAVLISRPRLLYPICFLKAFSFGFCACGITGYFLSAGWLVRGLLLFSDVCLIPVLLWLWLRHLDGSRGAIVLEFASCAALAFLIVSLDRCMVSPFLAMLIEI